VFDEQALVSFVVDELFDFLPRADRVFVMLWDAEGAKLVPGAARTRAGQPTEIIVSRTLLNDVMTSRKAVVSVDLQGDSRYAAQQSIHALRLRAAICAPIIFHEQIYGVIQVDSALGASFFDQADLGLALSLASQVGMALGYARLHASAVQRELLERDMSLARKLQQNFLPPGPLVAPGYSCAVEYKPALAVGGDFYDFLDLGGGLVGVVVGDVSGKGVSAALYAARLTSDLRHQAAGQTAPAAILDRTNRATATRDNQGMFATVAVAVLDPRSRRMHVASAGHPLPLARTVCGEVTMLGKTGDSPLGIDPAATFQQYGYEIDPGDAIVMYTDGVSEALNDREELFGEDRLIEALKRSDGTVDGILGHVQSDIRVFVGGEPQSDDVTMVCLRCDVERPAKACS
jgi:sigma-B regulation protein RsbU (phosphoserine phosphatase)